MKIYVKATYSVEYWYFGEQKPYLTSCYGRNTCRIKIQAHQITNTRPITPVSVSLQQFLHIEIGVRYCVLQFDVFLLRRARGDAYGKRGLHVSVPSTSTSFAMR